MEVSHENEEEAMQLRRAGAAITISCFIIIMSIISVDLSAETTGNTGQEAYMKAQAAWEKGEWENALTQCDEALKINKRYKDAWLLKGQIYWQMKNHKMALGCFDEYLKIDPKNVLVWVNRGANLFELERYKEMQENYDKALSIDPKYSPLYKSIGVNYLLMGNYEESNNAFKKLEELGETSMYYSWTKRMLKITNEAYAPPESWTVNLDSYQTVLDIADSSKSGFLINLTSTEGTAIKFGGTSDRPFKYAPNFEVWGGAMIFDKRGDGLLTSGTYFRYKKIAGDTLTIEEGQINNWRLGLSSKKCFLISQ